MNGSAGSDQRPCPALYVLSSDGSQPVTSLGSCFPSECI